MKKIFAVILVLVVCLTTAACGEHEKDDGVVTSDLDGKPCINGGKIWEITRRTELTVENWRDCLIVHSFERAYEAKDAFGEVVKTGTELCYYLGADVTRYHAFSEDAIIELKNKTTGEVAVHQLATTWVSYGPEDSTEALIVKDLDDYECTRIRGFVYYIDIPESAILPADETSDLAGLLLYPI